MKKIKSAGGFHSVNYAFKIFKSLGFFKTIKTMLSKNTCRTCALGMGGQKGGMTNEQGKFPELCKKSLQALKSDLQRPISNDLFQKYSIAELGEMTAQQIESLGRISAPLYAEANDTHFKIISWEEAFNKIVKKIKMALPKECFFYFSGRSSNEAGFLLQVFARQLGCNHVNNCSYYCHQASGVALSASFNSSTATVNIDDIDQCDLFFLIGANPSSNHPRLLTSLMHLKRRGGKVIVVNPTIEPGLVRFKIPSDIISLLFGSKIASEYITPHAGGDFALFSGMAKSLIEQNKIDKDFIKGHTNGYEKLKTYLEGLKWSEIVSSSGVSKQEILYITRLYLRSERTIFSWAMGITHHTHGVDSVQSIINLALLRGMVGKSGAGLLPLRGHSNVQGMGTMGVTPELKREVFENLTKLGVDLPTHKGFDTMKCMEAAKDKKIHFACCLGGNLYESNPDLSFASQAMNKIAFILYLNTTLNKGHFYGRGKETLILPVFARDEGNQKTTQESMFSFVRLSDGGPVRVPEAKSEIEIISRMAALTFPNGPILWDKMSESKNVRKLIAQIIPQMGLLSSIDKTLEEKTISKRIFHSPQFNTSDYKANFLTPDSTLPQKNEDQLYMMSVRSEGQYNSIVYEEEDAFRKITKRNVILMNQNDMAKKNLKENQKVCIKSKTGRLDQITVKEFNIREGNTLMYYPESNILISRELDPKSLTPGYKKTLIDILPY